MTYSGHRVSGEVPDGGRAGGLVRGPLIRGGLAGGGEGRDRAGERAAEGAGRGGGLAEHGAGGVGVEGVEEEGKLSAVHGASAGRVRSRDVVELVDVGGVAGGGVVIGDGEGPVAEDDLGLDFGE